MYAAVVCLFASHYTATCITESEVITGAIARSIHQGLGLRFPCNGLTFGG